MIFPRLDYCPSLLKNCQLAVSQELASFNNAFDNQVCQSLLICGKKGDDI
jgi:hypothetical protein